MLDKVRKLLAKAEDPACTPQEAAAFNDKAAELIAKYGVDQALLAATDARLDPVGGRVIDVPAPYARDKVSLLGGVALALRCKAVQVQRAEGYSVHVFGCASDLERVELLFTSLLVQAAYGLAAAAVPGWESVAAYRRSWLAGFQIAVVQRLREAERRAAAGAAPGPGGRSLALVLVDRGRDVDRALAEAYPRVSAARPRRLAGSGRNAGAIAGQQADLGGHRVAGRPTRSLRPG